MRNLLTHALHTYTMKSFNEQCKLTFIDKINNKHKFTKAELMLLNIK